jgi:antitoxin component YwqK of YwqJK toxin-antitoxin module
MTKYLLLLGILCSSSHLISRSNPILGYSHILQAEGEGEINKKDELGRKQGQWIIKGKDRPSSGYPENGKIEEGQYTDNRKNGFWTKYFKDGKTPKLIGEFKDGRPKGEYTKLYENGKVREKGTFVDGKQSGTYTTYHPNGKVAQEKNFNEAGLEEGVQKYYYPNGQVEFEFEKKNGVTTGKAVRYTEDGQIKEIITYGKDGKVEQREVKEVKVEKPIVTAEGNGGPSGEKGNMRGKTFDRDGYNKVYNENEELWLDGKFKAGKLFDGKLYKYDADGILLKIEVWKNGKYHSDGQL